MAISKRLRYEILRRDNHTCRYCGAMAPDVALHVDHVDPVALGGTDEPTNLITACQDCNAGKSSVQPGDRIVEDVRADALRWARAIEAAAHNMLAEREILDGFLERFKAAWSEWTYAIEVVDPPDPVPLTGDALTDNWRRFGVMLANHSRPVGFSDGVLRIQVERGYVTDARRDLGYADKRQHLAEILGSTVDKVEVVAGWDGPLPSPASPTKRIERRTYPLPAGWQSSVERFFAVGLPEAEIHRLLRVAMDRKGVALDERFRFFCGCCWRAVTNLQEDARRFIETET